MYPGTPNPPLVYLTKEAKTINTSEKMKEVLTKSVNPRDNKIKPDRVIKVRNNGVPIESSTREIEGLINSEKLNEVALEVRRPRKLWPKVTWEMRNNGESEKPG
ncbi:hypothetical protein MTP99_009152 [Tenebrio molitor]|jgi:hypothetical protein|nr:hypothetical protein MTP99_009152 [Tenebrio molitor]